MVDDEAEIVDVLRDFFEGLGYSVNCALNGRDALVLASLSRPDAVILDVRMPGRSGADVLHEPGGGYYERPPGFESGGGGLVSTHDDLAGFGLMRLNEGAHGRERILARPSVELMTMDHLTAAQKASSPFFENFWQTRGWGLGLAVTTARNDLHEVPGRFGWDGAFGTSWYVDTTEQLVGVLMIQRRPDTLNLPAITHDFWTLAYQLIDE